MLFLTACFPKNFAADRCNIMQEGFECLEVTHSHPNFTLGNQFKEIMKKNADAGNIDNRRNPHRRGSSSKNAEIENYLSTHYEFRYNTVLERTEYRSRNSGIYTKVGRYEINTLRRELDCDEGIATSSDNLYSIIESSFSPRINPVQEYFKALPLIDISDSSSCDGERVSGIVMYFTFHQRRFSIWQAALLSVILTNGCRILPNGLWRWSPMR